MRVLIADDHAIVRQGLVTLLEKMDNMQVVGEAENGEKIIELTHQLIPDLVIIDITMPKLNGIEATKQIKAACPEAAILMVSAYGYESYLLASLQAGASGYVLKSSPLRELVNAVRSVHGGQAVFDLKAAGKVLHRLASDQGIGVGPQRLHPRELQVLRLTAKGFSNKEIARELDISDRTVQTHLVRIFRELGVSSRTEAVLHALREGWFTLDELP